MPHPDGSGHVPVRTIEQLDAFGEQLGTTGCNWLQLVNNCCN